MRLFLFISCLLLCGCQNGQATKKHNVTLALLSTDDFTIEISKRWSRKAGQGTDGYHLKFIPAIDKDHVFVADNTGGIKALSSKNGALLWKKNIRLPVTSGLSINKGPLLLGSSEGDVLALDPDTGATLWHSNFSSEVLSPPQQTGDTVIIRTTSEKIIAVDVADGKRLWDYSSAVPTLTLHGTSPPVITDRQVIAGFDSGKLVVLALETGKVIWEYMTTITAGYSELERLADIDAAPIVIDDIIYFATAQGQIIALDRATAEPVWINELTSYARLGADDARLYITDKQGQILALDRFSGAVVWAQEGLIGQQLTGPAVSGELIVIGAKEGHLYWLDKYSGRLVKHNKVSGADILIAPIATAEGLLYVYTDNGTISSYSYIRRDLERERKAEQDKER